MRQIFLGGGFSAGSKLGHGARGVALDVWPPVLE